MCRPLGCSLRAASHSPVPSPPLAHRRKPPKTRPADQRTAAMMRSIRPLLVAARSASSRLGAASLGARSRSSSSGGGGGGDEDVFGDRGKGYAKGGGHRDEEGAVAAARRVPCTTAPLPGAGCCTNSPALHTPSQTCGASQSSTMRPPPTCTSARAPASATPGTRPRCSSERQASARSSSARALLTQPGPVADRSTVCVPAGAGDEPPQHVRLGLARRGARGHPAAAGVRGRRGQSARWAGLSRAGEGRAVLHIQ